MMTAKKQRYVLITTERMDELKTSTGGYTRSTVEALGESWQKYQKIGVDAWRRSLLGTVITIDTFVNALSKRHLSVNFDSLVNGKSIPGNGKTEE